MRINRCRKSLILVAGLGWAVIANAQAPDASVRVEREGVSLTVTPIARAQTLAFYGARGFAAEAIAPYAAACGFSFGMQNGGTATLVTRLADWHAVGADGKRVQLRLPSAWDAEWTRAKVPQPARIAFRWAQFQAENTFEPGDWIMGMATLEARPSAPFRLVARYRDHKGDHEIVLDTMACAND